MLSTKKRKALEALLTTKNRMEAAKVSGCAADTLRRYLLEDEFRREYEKRQAEMLDEAALSARRLINSAFAALEQLLTDADISDGVRASAARSILEHSVRVVELHDICSKLDEFEAWKSEMEDKR